MKTKDFDFFKPYFSTKEKWGDISKVQWHHVHHLFLIRERLSLLGYDWPMIIHCSFENSGHSPNSYHYKGLATDFHFKTNEPLLKQYTTLRTALDSLSLNEFCGVGVYFWWNNQGFHFDSRGSKMRWTSTKQGEYDYQTD